MEEIKEKFKSVKLNLPESDQTEDEKKEEIMLEFEKLGAKRGGDDERTVRPYVEGIQNYF